VQRFVAAMLVELHDEWEIAEHLRYHKSLWGASTLTGIQTDSAPKALTITA